MQYLFFEIYNTNHQQGKTVLVTYFKASLNRLMAAFKKDNEDGPLVCTTACLQSKLRQTLIMRL